MKITFHSIDELLQLFELIRPPQTTCVTNNINVKSSANAAHFAKVAAMAADLADRALPEPNGLPADIDAPQAEWGDEHLTPSFPPDHQVIPEFPERDADGATYSTDWHSAPKKLNADGRWKARRGRDATAYTLWLREVALDSAQTALNEVAAEAGLGTDEEPVATETHALPQADGDEAAAEPQEAGSEPTAAPAQPASTVDLQALVASSQEAAMDAKDGLQDLLAGCRDFTSAHGTAEFNALKAAVAPRGDTGASLQEFTPAERRLMLACIANYPKPA